MPNHPTNTKPRKYADMTAGELEACVAALEFMARDVFAQSAAFKPAQGRKVRVAAMKRGTSQLRRAGAQDQTKVQMLRAALKEYMQAVSANTASAAPDTFTALDAARDAANAALQATAPRK